MAVKYDCVECRKQVTATKNQRYRTHTTGDGEPCGMSSEPIPEHILAQPVGEDDRPEVPREGVDFAKCPSCERNVKLTQLGYFEPHGRTLMGAERCPLGGVRAKHARATVDLNLPEPEGADTASPLPAPAVATSSEGEPARSNLARQPMTAPSAAEASTSMSPPANGPASIPTAALEEPARSNLARQPMVTVAESEAEGERWIAEADAAKASDSEPSPGSTTTWNGSPPYDGPPSLYGVKTGRFWQPGSPYLQPPEWLGSEKPEPMTGLAADIATMVKETFYSYSNRKTTDNRTAQTTLGPSEVGTPCDRRLAMELLSVPYVNPGGDGWASFVGTCGHTGMADIYTFADAGTGRYAIEFPVTTPSPWVPRGTSDLFDRRIFTIIDWKFMGAYSLKKFKLEGPSETYLVQGDVYGLGAELAGEKVRNVAIVGLPRAGSSLDEMHVHVRPYDRKRAEKALKRVDEIATRVQGMTREPGSPADVGLARHFDVADDCRYCPFFRKNDTNLTKGCPGV